MKIEVGFILVFMFLAILSSCATSVEMEPSAIRMAQNKGRKNVFISGLDSDLVMKISALLKQELNLYEIGEYRKKAHSNDICVDVKETKLPIELANKVLSAITLSIFPIQQDELIEARFFQCGEPEQTKTIQKFTIKKFYGICLIVGPLLGWYSTEDRLSNAYTKIISYGLNI